MCIKNDIIGKRKGKNPEKDEWGLTDVIPLMAIAGVNHRLPILHLSKIMVHIYSTENTIYKFSIGYMINPSLRVNRIFVEQVQNFLGCSFSTKTMKTIRDFLLKNNIYVMALMMIYETVGKDIRKVYRALSCVVYTLIDNMFVLTISRVNKKMHNLNQSNIYRNKFQFITRYWHSITVTEPGILSCIHDKIEFNCDIKLPITSN